MEPQPLSTQYVYKPLREIDEIRLLHIAPGSWDCEPECTLSNHRLSQYPQFEALSYVWGNDEKPYTIKCGEIGRLAVTRNCFSAIKRLRKLGSLVVWIDAVCIDQDNDIERGHQVKNMPVIYNSARKVLVYLGEAEQGSDKAMEDILSQEWTFAIFDHNEPVQKVMQRSWFKRIWVLQEAHKAQTLDVICGNHVVPWDDDFRLFMDVHGSKCFQNVGQKALPYAFQQTWDLFDLLESTRFFECTDPRDRIFALLSMSSEITRLGIDPDYTATVEEVYTKAATAFMTRKGLDVLATVDHCHEEALSLLPTWVPDWRRRPTCMPLVKAITFDTISSFKSEGYFLITASTLRIRGRFFGNIHELGEVPHPDDLGQDKHFMHDVNRRFVKQYLDSCPSAVHRMVYELASGRPWPGFGKICHDPFTPSRTSFRATLRSLTQSIAHTVSGIVENKRQSRPAKEMKSQSDHPELLFGDAFLDLLHDPRTMISFEHAVPESLLEEFPDYFQVFKELYEARFQSVSYTTVMRELKRELRNDISVWPGSRSELPDTTSSGLSVNRKRRYERKSLQDLFIHYRRKSTLKARPYLPPRVNQKQEAILSLVRMHSFNTIAKKVRLPEQNKTQHAPFWQNHHLEDRSIRLALLDDMIEQSWNIPERSERIAEVHSSSATDRAWDAYLCLWKDLSPIESSLTCNIDCCKGRRVFVNDYIAGVVPASAQRDDILCIPSGGRFPILLRQVGEHFRFVGACYVIGDIASQVQDWRDLSII